MMKRQVSSSQRGFTLIELLIATTVFSVILLVVSATLIQVSRMYYKGVITSKTQNVTRSVMDDVSRTIQFSNGSYSTYVSPTDPPYAQTRAICMGKVRWTYVVGPQMNEDAPDGTYNAPGFTNQIRHVLWQDTIGSETCDNDIPDLKLANPNSQAANPNRNGKELLENKMRLIAFNVTPLEANSRAYAVNVRVIYGDTDLLDISANPIVCKGSAFGSQWCAISGLSSVVYKRVE